MSAGASRPAPPPPRPIGPPGAFGGGVPRWGAVPKVDAKKMVYTPPTIFDDLPLEPALFPEPEPGRGHLNWAVRKK
jgi:hypothetical protein